MVADGADQDVAAAEDVHLVGDRGAVEAMNRRLQLVECRGDDLDLQAEL